MTEVSVNIYKNRGCQYGSPGCNYDSPSGQWTQAHLSWDGSDYILSPITDNCPTWISSKNKMAVDMISWPIYTKECFAGLEDQTCDRLNTRQTCVRPSYQARLYHFQQPLVPKADSQPIALSQSRRQPIALAEKNWQKRKVEQIKVFIYFFNKTDHQNPCKASWQSVVSNIMYVHC